jgi:hypothetical protein
MSVGVRIHFSAHRSYDLQRGFELRRFFRHKGDDKLDAERLPDVLSVRFIDLSARSYRPDL